MGSRCNNLIVFSVLLFAALATGFTTPAFARYPAQVRQGYDQQRMPTRYQPAPNRYAARGKPYAANPQRYESYNRSRSQSQPHQQATYPEDIRSQASGVQQSGYPQLVIPKHNRRSSSLANQHPQRQPPARMGRKPDIPFIPAHYRRPQDDPFGENQATEQPKAAGQSAIPSIFDPLSTDENRQAEPGTRRKLNVFGEGYKPEPLLPGLPETRETELPSVQPKQGPQPPRLPGEAQFMPEPRRNQTLPSPDAVEEELERERAERERELRDLRRRRERAQRERNQNRKKPRRSRATENDRGDENNDTLLPDDPGADRENGPLSWYRPTPDVPPMPPVNAPGRAPDGFGDPGIYATQPQIPTYQQPAIPAAPYRENYGPAGQAAGYATASSAELYAGVMCGDSLLPSCAEGGCVDSCATGCRVNSHCEPTCYLSLFGGYTDVDALSINENPGSSLFEVDDGYGLGAALGQYQGQNLRTEIEFSYRNNSISRLDLIGNANLIESLPTCGTIESYTGMANVLWEFTRHPCARARPYVGAGFGFVNAKTDLQFNDQNIIAPDQDSDSSFAYQWLAGLNYRVHESLDVFVEYRFLKADSLRLETTGVRPSPPGGTGNYDYQTNNVFGGVRIKF